MKTIQRRASAKWSGSGLGGSGKLTTLSGALKDRPYSTHARFVDVDGTEATNPEELIGAALAGCYAMALSFDLEAAGHVPETLDVSATVGAQSPDVSWTITQVKLDVVAKVPGIDAAKFREVAEQTRKNCPVSRALKVEIVLDARLA